MKNKPKYLKRLLFCQPDKLSGISKEEAIKQMIEKSKPNKPIGFAGFIEKKYLENRLKVAVLGEKNEVSLPNISKDKKLIEKIVLEALSKCKKEIDLPDLHIFIFPTQDEFIKNKMNGSAGFSVYKGAIHAYINNNIEGWDKTVPKTIAHETAHAISQTNFEWETILDAIIFEGLAEHFREKVVGGGHDPWTQVLTKKEAKEIMRKLIKNNLLDKDWDGEFYYKLFHGTGEYPLWAGYSIGYAVIGEVLKKEDITITELLEAKPKKVLEIYKSIT